MGAKFGMWQISPHWRNVSPLRGEKPQNRPLSNLNNPHFALRTMLPANNPKIPRYTKYHHNRFTALFPGPSGEPARAKYEKHKKNDTK